MYVIDQIWQSLALDVIDTSLASGVTAASGVTTVPAGWMATKSRPTLVRLVCGVR